ncbi:polysaccharide biosynthesis/export family protein [Halovulum sp. GXIMD14793]
MRSVNIARAGCTGVLCLTMLLAACALPRSGPNAREIAEGSTANGGEVNIVMVTEQIARASNRNEKLGFSNAFLKAGTTSTDAISPGDTLSVTVWENVENGLLAGVGQKVTVLQEIQVDQAGNIFMPYAGVLKAAGKTPEQLRLLITRNLDTQTPDPQVEVRRVAGDGSSVSVIGGVGAQGVYPIQPSTTRLSSMLATAGGVTIDPEIARIAVRRGSSTGRIFLQELYDNPSVDVALRPNDKIIVEEDRRAFTALGATGTQARVPFPRAEINVIEALAEVGGLDGNTSDPTGIFVFRREPRSVGQNVTGNPSIGENAPFAYVIDLTKPTGFFIAKEFQVRDDDTIYITQAPFVSWAKVLQATSSTLDLTANIARTAEVLSGR